MNGVREGRNGWEQGKLPVSSDTDSEKDKEELVLKIQKEPARQAEEIMVYLKEPQVLLKHSTCVCVGMCVCVCVWMVNGKGEEKGGWITSLEIL